MTKVSRMTSLLIDRTISLVMADRSILHAEFVAVRGEVIGSNVAPWVMLKKYEFVDMFAPAEGVQLQ